MMGKIIILGMFLALISCDQEQAINKPQIQKKAILAEEQLDTLLKLELEALRIRDQTLRKLVPLAKETLILEPEALAFFNILWHEHDSICEAKTRKILDTHGWLSLARVGYLANQTQWLVVQHAHLSIQEKYLPMLASSVQKGESEGWYLAFLDDRIRIRQGKKQRYGSQASPNPKTGKAHIDPIENVGEVNKRRRQIGLPTIEEYASENGYIFNKDEHL